MYIQNNLLAHPVFVWSGNADFVYSFSNVKSKSAKLVSSTLHSSLATFEQNPSSQSFIFEILELYQRFTSSLKKQQQAHKQRLHKEQSKGRNEDKKSIKFSKTQAHHKNRFQIFKTTVYQLMTTIQRYKQFSQDKSFHSQLNMYHTILNFIQQIYISPSTIYPRSPQLPTIFSFFHPYSIQLNWQFDVYPVHVNQILRLCNFGLLSEKIDAILITLELEKHQMRFYIAVSQLLKQRRQIMSDRTTSDQQKFQKYITYIQKPAKLTTRHYQFLSLSPSTLTIMLVISGDLPTLSTLANKNWKLYLALYITYHNPFIQPDKLFGVIRQYICKYKIALNQCDMLEQLMLSFDFEQVRRFSEECGSYPVVACLGFMAGEFGLFKERERKQWEEESLEENMLRDMFPWIFDKRQKWQYKAPFIKRFIEVMKIQNHKEYIDVIVKIIEANIQQYFPINNQQDYNKIQLYFTRIQQLKLPYPQQMIYIQNLLSYQTIISTNIRCIFDLVLIYQNKSHLQRTLIEQFYLLCMNSLQQLKISCRKLEEFITEYVRLEKFKEKEKFDKFMGLFEEFRDLGLARKGESKEECWRILKKFNEKEVGMGLGNGFQDVYQELRERFADDGQCSEQDKLELESIQSGKWRVKYHPKF